MMKVSFISILLVALMGTMAMAASSSSAKTMAMSSAASSSMASMILKGSVASVSTDSLVVMVGKSNTMVSIDAKTTIMSGKTAVKLSTLKGLNVDVTYCVADKKNVASAITVIAK